MAEDPQSRCPDSFTSGDTLKFGVPQGDYDPASYTTLLFELHAVGSTVLKYTVPTSFGTIANAGDGTWTVTVPATDTAGITAQEYAWFFRISDGSETYTIDRGTVTVRPNPADSAHDPRTHNRKVLDALQSVIEGKASQDQAGYSIGGPLGRAITRMSWTELEAAVEKYAARVRAEVRRERARRGLPAARDLRVRFTR